MAGLRTTLLAAPLGALLVTTIAVAAPGDRWRERIAARQAEAASRAPAAPLPEAIPYGLDARQRLDLWRASNPRGLAPLVIFVHGGGWSRGSKDTGTGPWKPAHYPGAGCAFASIDYRLVPDATVEQQAGDVAAALKALLGRADALGIDRRQVVLMGHSAGAHLVALVGTDERYLREAGLSFSDLAGVIALDGAGYDVPGQLTDAGPRLRQTYQAAFSNDPGRQRALSPLSHAGAGNAGRFLLLHVDRPDSARQSRALGEALRRAGTPATVEAVAGRSLTGHMEINRRMGDPDYAGTAIVDAWLAALFRN